MPREMGMLRKTARCRTHFLFKDISYETCASWILFAEETTLETSPICTEENNSVVLQVVFHIQLP